MSVVFSREDLTDTLWDEATPLLQKHWEEVAHYRDVPLEPDREYYAAMHTAGFVRCFTARSRHPDEKIDPNKAAVDVMWLWPLVGYALYFVKHHPHYKSTLFAAQDVIYLDRCLRRRHKGSNRPVASHFVEFCDRQLAVDGVVIVAQHMKIAHPFRHLLAELDYKPMDEIWTKQLA